MYREIKADSREPGIFYANMFEKFFQTFYL